MDENEDFLYDNDEAVIFIKKRLTEDLKKKFSDDDINYIIDLIYDFYDSKGLLDGNDDNDEVDINESELMAFVVKNAMKDGAEKYNAEDIEEIVTKEMDYCDSIGMFK